MASLLRISDDIVRLDRMIEDAGGELTPEIDAALSELEGQLQEKAGAYVGLIREMERRAEARRVEYRWLREQADREDAIAEQLKGRLLAVMKRHGIDSMRAEPYTLTVANNGGKVPMEVNADDVPDDWKRVVLEVDKERIRAALEAGKTVPGAVLGQRGQHLRVR